MPGLERILGAPDVLGFLHRTLAQDGDEEGVDRHVVQIGDLVLQLVAVVAIRVFKNGHLALALAAHLLDGVFQRQGVKLNGRELFNALFRQVLARARVDEIALQNEIALGVGVEDVVAHADFVHPLHRRLAHLVNVGERRQPLAQGFAQIGLLRQGGRQRQGQGQSGQQ